MLFSHVKAVCVNFCFIVWQAMMAMLNNSSISSGLTKYIDTEQYTSNVSCFLFYLQGDRTPLILVSYSGQLDLISPLLLCGANVNAQDKVCMCETRTFYLALLTGR